MSKPLVYLAGAITGCSYNEATDWRETFPKLVGDSVICLSPMRGKAYLSGIPSLKDDYEDLLAGQRGIWSRDHYDVHQCNCLVANLLGSVRVSIGTMFELAWASERRIPVVAIMESKDNLHDHPFVREATNFRVTSLDEAAETVRLILV